MGTQPAGTRVLAGVERAEDERRQQPRLAGELLDESRVAELRVVTDRVGMADERGTDPEAVEVSEQARDGHLGGVVGGPAAE